MGCIYCHTYSVLLRYVTVTLLSTVRYRTVCTVAFLWLLAGTVLGRDHLDSVVTIVTIVVWCGCRYGMATMSMSMMATATTTVLTALFDHEMSLVVLISKQRVTLALVWCLTVRHLQLSSDATTHAEQVLSSSSS